MLMLNRLHLCPGASARSSRRRAVLTHQSIRDFIAAECPVSGFDGRVRERPRDSDMEAAVIGGTALLSPGCTALLRVPQATLDQVIQDQGQVLLCVMQPEGEQPQAGGPSGRLTPLQPPKGGSYCTLGQSFGIQRLPGGGGYVRVVAQQRVVVQALRAGEGGAASLRAQASVLQDRWAYYVRAQVVEEVLDNAIAACGGVSRASLDNLDLNGQPADVRTAVASMQDVALQLQSELLELRELLTAQGKRAAAAAAGTAAATDSDRLVEVLDELERVVDFVQGPVGSGADVHSYAALERLSYAVFAAEELASFAGMAMSELDKQRRKAMEATDTGLRLEAALDFLSMICSRLAARAALT